MNPPAARGGRRWWRLGRWFLAVVAGYAAAVLGFGMNPSTPVDYAMNLGPAPHRAELVAPADGVRRLVVLQHGLWRSAGSLWKLERALQAHGYEVLNVSYPSTEASIAEHAARLRPQVLAAWQALGPGPKELHLVGHSMGGLVLRALAQGEGMPAPTTMVTLGTPHGGAVLVELRRDLWLFRLLMGSRAALEMAPRAPFLAGLRPPAFPLGTIVGGRGDQRGWHDAIPGDDDGTVAVAEAGLQGAADSIRVPVGHTRISFDDRAILQVLAFLKERRFRRDQT